MRQLLDLHVPRVYLAGPRTWTDPEVWGPVEATLLDLGLICEPAQTAFRTVAEALRSAGLDVFSPFEQSRDLDGVDSRAGRAADQQALANTELVVVLDGWADVPGAVDAAVLVAATRGVCWASASTALRTAAVRMPAA